MNMGTPMKFFLGFIAYFITNIVGRLFSGFINVAFPTAPTFVIFLASPLLIGGILYFLVQKYVNNNRFDGVRDEDTPKWYQGRAAIAIGAVLGGLLGGFSAFTENSAQVYFDNGTKEAVTLKYISRSTPTEISIPAGEAKDVYLSIGDQKISLNGKERALNVVLTERQLFNIDTANTYIRTEVTYGKESSLKTDEEDKSETIKDEFFPIKAEYVFEAPKSIRTKRLTGSKTKTVLYRMTDLIQEIIKGGMESAEPPGPEPAVEQAPKPEGK
jgi:hypothetical protein